MFLFLFFTIPSFFFYSFLSFVLFSETLIGWRPIPRSGEDIFYETKKKLYTSRINNMLC